MRRLICFCLAVLLVAPFTFAQARATNPDRLQTKTYAVQPSIGARIAEMDGGGADFQGISDGHNDWKQFFQEMGVSWPVGSSIKLLLPEIVP